MLNTLVLFDIDGTLLTSASAGRDAIRRAFAEELEDLGFFSTVRFDGKTDPHDVRELYTAAGLPDRATDAATRDLLDRYLKYLVEELDARRGRVLALPGVHELLTALEARGDVCVGLLTGNVVTGAELKLNASGIGFSRFKLGAYGSDGADRPMLPPIAVERAIPLFGRVPTGGEIVIVGDTPADVTCGSAMGVRAIAVATGAYSESELQDAGAHATFATLASTDDVLDSILAVVR
jgi:phosphoglycolate phosphatase